MCLCTPGVVLPNVANSDAYADGSGEMVVFPTCHWRCEDGKMSLPPTPLSAVGFRLIFLVACWERKEERKKKTGIRASTLA